MAGNLTLLLWLALPSITAPRCGPPTNPAARNGVAFTGLIGFGTGPVIISVLPDRPSITVNAAQLLFSNPSVRYGLSETLRLSPDRELLAGLKGMLVPGIVQIGGEALYGWHLGGTALPDKGRVYGGLSAGVDILTVASMQLRTLFPFTGTGVTVEFGISARPVMIARLLGGKHAPVQKTIFTDPTASWNAVGRIRMNLGIEFAELDSTTRPEVFRVTCESAEGGASSVEFIGQTARAIRAVANCPTCSTIADAVARLGSFPDYTKLPVECVAYALEHAEYPALLRGAFPHQCSGF